MPGRLGRNLREGHRAEGLGVELLRPLCAVAQVPQTEDVGFDAVATILRADGRFLMAEQSFCAQFKARSVATIAYDRAAYDWLRKLALPLFIGSVDLAMGEIALYTTHHAACRIDAEHYSSLVMSLKPSSGTEKGVLHQYLGEPILRWTERESRSSAFQKQAHAVLAAWVATEQVHYPLRSIKTTEAVRWKTNELPQTDGTMMLGHPDDIRADVEAAAPYLMKIGSHFMVQETLTPEAVGFLLFARWLEQNGSAAFTYMPQILVSRLALAEQHKRQGE